ncbi:MAG: nuclear transport factor 2 family protein [Planctomycetota bacterium]|nr:nuclear transport factor 2 family protein [Planctomycetota bacterium]
MKRVKLNKVNVGWIASIIALAMILLASNGTAVVQPPESSAMDSTVVPEVKSFMKKYLETLKGNDEAAIRALYVQDSRFSWFTDGQRLYATPDDIVKSLAEIRNSGMELNTNVSGLNIIPLSDHHAYVLADFSTKATMGEREVFGFAGVLTILVERSKTDEWHVLHGHSSTPGGPQSSHD